MLSSKAHLAWPAAIHVSLILVLYLIRTTRADLIARAATINSLLALILYIV
jgi:hypothetical protein